MSHLNSSFLSAYNSLADKHLAGYFNNTRIRRHLQRAGLITRSGGIVPEKELRLKLIRRDHQRRIRACLSQAIFHKVLDIERHRRIEIKRKLEDFARKEHVHKMKVQHSKRHSEGIVPLISPKPPPGPRNKHALHSGTEGEQSESSLSPGSSQPSSAPGRRQRPVRLQPLYSNSTTASTQRAPHCCRCKDSSDDTEPYRCSTLNRETRRHGTMPEFTSGISPYRLPVINNYVMPIPPPANRSERSSKGTTNGRTRGRSLRPTTAPDVPAVTKDSRFHKTAVHSNVSVTMTFYGKAVHLIPDTVDRRDEVRVFQQHCGGENVCVYRGKLAEGEAFQFVSRRHLGFPFSLTFFLNGMQVERLSSCCEFRHRRGSRLGGKRGQFGFTVVDGASPCYKCIIALGLDKKPTPPPRRLHSDTGTADTAGSSSLQMAVVSRKARAVEAVEHPQSRPESRLGQAEHHAVESEAQEVHPEENEQGAQDDYEEDFEEEDERVDEDAEKTRACALVNGVSSCPSQEGGDSHSDSKEDEVQDHHEREDDDECRYSDSEAEEEKAKEKKSASVSSGSISPFSSSRKEDPDSEAEEVKEAIKDSGVDPYSGADYPTELGRKGQAVQDPKTGQGGDTAAPALRDKSKEEEHLALGAAGNTKDQPDAYSHPTSMKELDSETQEVHGSDASEASLEESDSSMPSEEKEATKWSGAKPEKDTGETQSAKSVQEKLTAAVSKETHISSELEMSDSSSDGDEPPTIDPDRTPEPDQTDTGVEAAAVAKKRNAEERAVSSDGALNISTVDPTPQEGELGTLEMGGEQEADQRTEEAHPDMEVEEAAALGDRDLRSEEPTKKGEESEEEAQKSGNSSTGTDSQADCAETETVGLAAGEGDRTDQMAEDSGTLTEAPDLKAQVMEEKKVKEHETEKGQKEGTESTVPTEATAFVLEKQDVNAEDTGEDEDMVEKAEDTEALSDAAVTVAGTRAEHPTETAEISNAEEDTEAEQETTDSANGEAEMMDGGKDRAEGENEEEAETPAEKPKDEVGEEDGGEAQTGTGDTDSKTEMTDDANNEKVATMLEDSEAADIPVEEAEKISWGTNATEKENTEGESSVGEKDKGLKGESKAAELLEEMSAKEKEPVRYTEAEANGLETQIKEGEMEEMESTGEAIEEAPVGVVPKREIDEEPTVDQKLGGKSRPGETNMTPASAQEAETLPEETLDMTEGTLLEVECTERSIKNGDTVDQGKGEEAVESSRPRTMAHPDERDLLNTETGGLEVETETEVPGDGIDVVKGDADMKEEEQKVKAAVGPGVGTTPEENEVNIDTPGLPDESPSQSKLQEKTRVVKSDVTGAGLQPKSEDHRSGHQASQLEEIEEVDKEAPEVDADVTECNVDGSEGKLEDSWVNTDHRDPHSQDEGSLNSTDIGGEGSENVNGEGTGISHKPGGAALEVEGTAAESTADGDEDRPEEEQRKMGEEEEVTAGRKEGRNAAALESTWNAANSRVDSKQSVSRSKSELGKGAKFPPPLIRRSRSYALTIAREGLSLQTLAVSDRERESPLAYAQTAAAITGNAFTASNQTLQSITTKVTEDL
ncbi:glutamate-rich protein 3-like isoform X3 [Anguilla anguilla]|uniref:glutamate-rich protein 3-like isoform X3 n=1 Tax=Anguilla anguilla TaxID=7936 RepID=UPI0015AA8062|nr:glutamate-rich protein 3-like isoform X3 [Anguilla anguilla]